MKINITKLLFILAVVVLPISFVNAQVMSYTPRLYATGLGGSSLMGRGDLLVPAYLGTNSNLFAYGMGRASRENNDSDNNPWTGSAGLGYRHVAGNAAMLGIYCLADYTDSPTQNYWVIGPGIEAIGRWLEFRANGYFPVDKKDWKTEGFADEFGDYSKVTVTSHEQYDHWYRYHEEIGPGGDAELGAKLAKIDGVLVKGYVNGYYFDMKYNDSVIGGGARLVIQPTNYAKISAAYSYDEYEDSTFMAGIQLSIYDLFNSERRHAGVDEQNLHQHLFDPLERQFATLGTAKAVPIVRNDTPEDIGNGLERTNIWFFKAAPASSNDCRGDGTAEHPFTCFNQASVNSLPDGANMWFAGNNSYSSVENFNPIAVRNGLNMEGRSADFKAPADLTQRPVFFGGLEFGGNNNLDRLIVKNATTNINDCITALGQNVNLSNVEVDVTGTAMNLIEPTGVVVGAGASVNFVSGKNTIHEADVDVLGIYAKDGGVVNFNGGTNEITLPPSIFNTVISVATGGTVNFKGGTNTAFRIESKTGGKINFEGGTNTMHQIRSFDNGTEVNFIGGVNAISSVIFAETNSQINFKNGTNTIGNVSIESGSQVDFTGGMNTVGLIGAFNGIVNFDGGVNTINGNNDFGIYAEDDSTINFRGGTNTINVLGDDATGIQAVDSTVNFITSPNANNVLVHITVDGQTAYGIFADEDSWVEENGSSITSGSQLAGVADIMRTGSGTGGSLADWWDGVNHYIVPWPPTK